MNTEQPSTDVQALRLAIAANETLRREANNLLKPVTAQRGRSGAGTGFRIPGKRVLAFPTVVADLVTAAAPEEADVVQAQFAVDLPSVAEGGPLPADIQWMPPGEHRIAALKNGKRYVTTMRTTPRTAEIVQAALQVMLADAAAGKGDLPFLDFGHRDGEASAHPTEAFWGGDDLKTGGVRLRVVWTDPGAAGVKGRSWRRFSPQFADDGKGNVTGVPVNMGGLVNRAAFKNIAPISAKDGSDEPDGATADTTNKHHPMDPKLKKHLAKLGLIDNADVDDADIAGQVSAKHSEMQTQIAKIKPLEDSKTSLEAEIVKAKETHAKKVVDNLVKCGAIPPKDEKLIKRYTDLIIADPDNEAILPKATNPALGKGQIVKAKSSEETSVLTDDEEDNKLIVRAKEIVAEEDDIDMSDAIVKACEEDDEEYQRYRVGLGLGSRDERKQYADAAL